MKLFIKCASIALIVLLAFLLWLHNDKDPVMKWNLFHVNETKKEDNTVRVTRVDGTVEQIPLQTYLEGVIGSEMPASYEEEALKAQCVAARTFVMQRGMEVDDTISTQVYHDEAQQKQIWKENYEFYHKKIKKVVEDTTSLVLTYDGSLISAVFFSSSCGKTGNSEEYWQSTTPYLRSVDSSWDQEMPDFEKVVDITEDDFHTKLGFENKVTEIGEAEYYESGYVKRIVIDRIEFSGRDIREKLNLRSSSFTIQKEEGFYRITTRGYGHGLGMSQVGAQAMAKQGKNYKEILLHYYTGAKIEKKDV